MTIKHVIHTPSPKVLSARGFIGKNLSPTLVRDKVKIEYIISEGQPSSIDLTFGVESKIPYKLDWNYDPMENF